MNLPPIGVRPTAKLDSIFGGESDVHQKTSWRLMRARRGKGWSLMSRRRGRPGSRGSNRISANLLC